MFLKIRIIAISFTLLILANSITFAQESRFETVTFQGKVLAKLDTETIKYENDPYTKELIINVWIKTIPDQTTGEYTLCNYLFNPQNRQSMVLNQISYDEDSDVISQTSNKYNYSLWTPNIPETLIDQWYTETVKYTTKHHKELMKQYKDRKSDKNENTAYDKFNSWLNDVGHLFSIN
jgi:hypothetical protein